jgi:hypothetical protein
MFNKDEKQINTTGHTVGHFFVFIWLKTEEVPVFP